MGNKYLRYVGLRRICIYLVSRFLARRRLLVRRGCWRLASHRFLRDGAERGEHPAHASSRLENGEPFCRGDGCSLAGSPRGASV